MPKLDEPHVRGRVPNLKANASGSSSLLGSVRGETTSTDGNGRGQAEIFGLALVHNCSTAGRLASEST
jgi:hypothetical protein